MKLIAYYLPQFHQIPENDKWWGEGFTEWTNMKKAVKFFDGQHQPRIPLDGYYDLSRIETLRKQAEIANKYNVYGWCFYHYWFNGKLLLEKPMELLLSDKTININYCISWANENWTNGWVSSNSKILISHDNNDVSDWKNHFNYFLKFFKDERYIKIDGKPLLILYFPTILSKCNEMINLWRQMAKENGFDDLFILYQQARFHFDPKSDKSNFDGGIEFMPGFYDWANSKNKVGFSNFKVKLTTFLQNKLHIYLHRNKKIKELKKLDYDKTWNWYLNEYVPSDNNMYPGAFVDWDNTPRKGIRGSAFFNTSVEKFGNYFSSLVDKTKEIYKKDIMFIFAWNEWAEGGHLEADNFNGYGYLEKIKNKLDK